LALFTIPIRGFSWSDAVILFFKETGDSSEDLSTGNGGGDRKGFPP
jgi:hypothetical protein